MISDRVLLIARVPFTKSADVLQDRAREIVARAGYWTPGPIARAVRRSTTEHIGWAAQRTGGPTAGRRREREASVLRFWYRESPRPLVPRAPDWTPTVNIRRGRSLV